MARGKFVFYDSKRKRWKRIQIGLRNLMVVAGVVTFLLWLAVFHTPIFGSGISELKQTPKRYIDFISTLKEEEIEVVGYGPLLTIETGKYGSSLMREKFDREKIVILSFDDGPDPVYTPKILQVLKEEGVRAEFFVVGEQLIRYPHLAKEIVGGGHHIGTHTFTHPSEEVDLYSWQNRLDLEFDLPQKVIEAQTGYKTRLFRVPHWGVEETISLNSLVLASYAIDRGYTVVSSTVDSLDWRETNKDKVVEHSVDLSSSQVILMHDGGGDRSATVESLPEIINQYRQAGYGFVTVDALLPDGVTSMSRASFFERVASKAAVAAYLFQDNFHNILSSIFKLTLGVMGSSIIITVLLAFNNVVTGKRKKNGKKFDQQVSVVVPAFNEEKTIGKTLGSLISSDYPSLEIIVVNNNSFDNTEREVRKFLSKGKVRLVREKKQGKFVALNKGISVAAGEIVIVIDADTQVLPDTIANIVQPFSDPKVGGVAGNLKVGNLVNSLTAFQAIEYTVGLNLDRRAYDVLSAIQVAPGALAAWRKKVLKKVGGYQGDTLTEDADLTVIVQKAGFTVTFAGDAVAYTEAPEDIKAFVRQRLRWTFGVLQVLYKHRGMLFRPRYGVLGMFILPYIAFVQLPLMLFSPFVDMMALIFLVYIPGQVVTYFVIFLALNYMLSIVAFVFAKERKVWLLALLPLSRVFYQSILYYVSFRSILTAIKGTYVPWKKLDHVGRFTIRDGGKRISIAPRLVTRDDQ